MTNVSDNRQISTVHPSFYEAFRFWLLLGFISFGGPTGQISIMYKELVEKKKWISNSRFLHALNYCMLLPGPEAIQLAIYIGWLLHRTWGGIVAGVLFVLPSVFILWVLSYIYVEFGTVPWIASIFYGLKPAVVAIVASAVIHIGNKALKNYVMWGIAALAFIGIFFFSIPFPFIIISAAIIGWVGGNFWIDKFNALTSQKEHETQIAVIHDTLESPLYAKPSWQRSMQVILYGLFIWWVPVIFIGYITGWANILWQEALFFSKVAMVTFGGAYAVLSYVAQYAVEYGWIFPGQMIDGLGLAESTPGPLIMVLQFVGFLGAWHHPDEMSPLVAATLGSFVTTWTTFVPCFLWIFLGAPYIEKFRGNVNLNATLSTVTAAVVGVVLNLAVWFAIQVMFRQEGGFDPVAFFIFLCAFFGMWKLEWGIIPVIFGSGFFGFVYKWLSYV